MRLPSTPTLLVLALAAGCSTVASGDDEAGVTTDPDGDGTATSGTSSTGDEDDEGQNATSSTFTTTADGDPDEAESEADEGIKLDVATMGDAPRFDECNSAWLDWAQVAAVYPDCPLSEGDENACWTSPAIGCRAPGPDGCVCPEGDCLDSWAYCEGDQLLDEPIGVCGPYVIDGLCCSVGEFIGVCAE